MTDAGDQLERTLILRLWREGAGANTVWRCSVEDPRTKQRRGFSSLAELFPFLDLITHGFESGALLDVLQEPQPRIPMSGHAPVGRTAMVVPDGVGCADSIEEES